MYSGIEKQKEDSLVSVSPAIIHVRGEEATRLVGRFPWNTSSIFPIETSVNVNLCRGYNLIKFMFIFLARVIPSCLLKDLQANFSYF